MYQRPTAFTSFPVQLRGQGPWHQPHFFSIPLFPLFSSWQISTLINPVAQRVHFSSGTHIKLFVDSLTSPSQKATQISKTRPLSSVACIFNSADHLPFSPHRSERRHQLGNASTPAQRQNPPAVMEEVALLSPQECTELFPWPSFFIDNCLLLYSIFSPCSLAPSHTQAGKNLSQLKKSKNPFLIALFLPSLYSQISEINCLCSLLQSGFCSTEKTLSEVTSDCHVTAANEHVLDPFWLNCESAHRRAEKSSLSSNHGFTIS